jgi:hypothetical protein
MCGRAVETVRESSVPIGAGGMALAADRVARVQVHCPIRVERGRCCCWSKRDGHVSPADRQLREMPLGAWWPWRWCNPWNGYR